jgi:hypothetical protein
MSLQISEAMGLSEIRNRQWSIKEATATSGAGLFEGFDWCVREQSRYLERDLLANDLLMFGGDPRIVTCIKGE